MGDYVRCPTIRELIHSPASERVEQVCGCCLEHQLHEIEVPAPSHDVPAVYFLVCERCDFSRI